MSSGQRKKDQKKDDDLNSEADQDDLFVERLRLEKMDLRLYAVFLSNKPPPGVWTEVWEKWNLMMST